MVITAIGYWRSLPAAIAVAAEMPLHDPGRASFTASHGAIRLGRSLALPESRKAV